MINKCLIIIMFVFASHINNAQIDSCSKVKFGYLLHYYQKSMPYVSTSSDYFFFDRLPNIDSLVSYSSLVFNGEITDIEYYSSKYLKLFISDGIDVLSFKDVKYKVKKTKDYSFVIYKIMIAYREKEILISDYLQKHNQPHTHSCLELSKNQTSKIKVIYPVLITSFD